MPFPVSRPPIRLIALGALAAFGLIAAGPAQAGGVVINFDNFTQYADSHGGSDSIGQTYDDTAAGFTFTGETNLIAYSGSGPGGDGETSLFGDGYPVTLTRDGGGAFSVTQIDLGPYGGNHFNYADDGKETLTGTKLGGGTVTDIVTTTSKGYQTFTFTNLAGLTSLTISPDYGPGQGQAEFDNLHLTPAPVPEASSVGSLGLLLALGGVALARRKRAAGRA